MTFTPRQAAEALGVTDRTLHRYRREGKVQVAQVTAGGHARYDEKHIKEVKKSWQDRVGTFRGSSGEKTVSHTAVGTTVRHVAPAAKASTPETPEKPPSVSAGFSSTALAQPGLASMLD